MLGLWLVSVGSTLVFTFPAFAEPNAGACGVERPWVELSVVADSPAFVERVLADLRAGLLGSRIDVCERSDAETPTEPLARLAIAPSSSHAERVHLEVRDAVTEKVLGREIDLGRVPSDGRAFALAVAAEELLRASWAELSVPNFSGVARRATAERASEPAVDARSPERGVRAPRARSEAFGLRFAYEAYRRGQTELGADVFWTHALGAHFALGLAAGAREALATTAPDGTVSAQALAGEISAQVGLLHGSWATLDGLLGLSGKWLKFSVDPAPGAVGTSAAGFALYGRAGLELSLGGPGISSRTRVGAGAPLSSFSASDAGHVVTGLRDVELFSSTGVAVEF
ncbi:MAG TPA: hypothetical protein VGI10_15685 [Polyangiaceae bacterium]|jgi:hypothetical protein